MQIKTISISSLELYLTCPFCWQCRYQQHLMGIESDALQIGSWVHQGLESFHNRKDPFLELKQIILKPPVDKKSIDDFGLVRRMVEAYINYYKLLPKDHPLRKESTGMEHKFKYEFHD